MLFDNVTEGDIASFGLRFSRDYKKQRLNHSQALYPSGGQITQRLAEASELPDRRTQVE